jgi:hypothetical protein
MRGLPGEGVVGIATSFSSQERGKVRLNEYRSGDKIDPQTAFQETIRCLHRSYSETSFPRPDACARGQLNTRGHTEKRSNRGVLSVAPFLFAV